MNVKLDKLSELFYDYLLSLGISDEKSKYLLVASWIILTIIISIIVNKITKVYVIKLVEKVIHKTKSNFDDYLIKRRVLHRLANLVPAIVIYSLLGVIFTAWPDSSIEKHARNALEVSFVVIFLWSVNAFLKSINDIYSTFSYAKERPIKGFLQLMEIIVIFIGGLIIISIIFDLKLIKVMTGLGAIAAVILLVFKDTILGFVASIQLTANKMISIGDWISMPSHNADGTVLDISINTVKVQNWDKTITTIPTYTLVGDSFINWQGMERSGGRRIKRSINIDMNTIKFCTPEMIERFKKIDILKDYISEKEKELATFNESKKDGSLANLRMLTNLGVFRRYMEGYLRHHPLVHDNMTFMVRHLQSTEKGQPLEIYVFSKDQEWIRYEQIQSDIFDHFLAVISEFELKVYQLPASGDFKKLL